LKEATAKGLRDLRPRLDMREIRFLVHVLENYLVTLDSMLKEENSIEREVVCLTRDFRKLVAHEILVELRAKRKLLEELKAWRFREQVVVTKDLMRRFEGLLKGAKRHPKWLAERSLSKLGFGSKNVSKFTIVTGDILIEEKKKLKSRSFSLF